MHSLGIVHRDLKFENLLLANETAALAAAHIKICDFGCAAWARPAARALDLSLAGDGDGLLRDLCGSPGYIAPEVIAAAAGGGAYGLQADVWSIGVVLYILLRWGQPAATSTPLELSRVAQQCCVVLCIRVNALMLSRAVYLVRPYQRLAAVCGRDTRGEHGQDLGGAGGLQAAAALHAGGAACMSNARAASCMSARVRGSRVAACAPVASP